MFFCNQRIPECHQKEVIHAESLISNPTSILVVNEAKRYSPEIPETTSLAHGTMNVKYTAHSINPKLQFTDEEKNDLLFFSGLATLRNQI